MLDLDPVQLMSVAAVFNYIVIVWGLYLFLNTYFRDYWAPAIGFLALFFVWGVAWNMANVYQSP